MKNYYKIIKSISPDLYTKIRLHSFQKNVDIEALVKRVNEIAALIEKEHIPINPAYKPVGMVLYPVPWAGHSLYMTLIAYLLRYRGIKMSIYLDDIVRYGLGEWTAILKDTLGRLNQNNVSVHYFSDFDIPPDIPPYDTKHGQHDALSMFISRNKSSFVIDRSEVEGYQSDLENKYKYIYTLCKNAEHTKLIVFNGVYRDTSLFTWMRDLLPDVDISFIEQWMCSANVLSTSKWDFTDFKKLYEDLPQSEQDWIIKESEREFEKRSSGEEEYTPDIGALQKGSKDQEFHYDIVIVPNVEWDAAALNMDKVYPTMSQWLKDIVVYIIENTSYSIAIRQHPAERIEFKQYGYRNDIAAYLQEKYRDNSRFRIYVPEDPVNTYALIKGCKVVLPWSSDVGVDAAILGKISVLHTNAYYRDEPYVISCETKEEYYNAIRRVCDNNLQNDHIREAKIAYFYHSNLSLASLGWDPILSYTDENFNKVVYRNVQDLVNNKTVAALAKSICENLPISWLNYKRMRGELKL